MGEDQERENDTREDSFASKKFIAFLFLGFALVIAGIIVMLFASGVGGGFGGFSGVIFIGPFPIVFGVGPNWYWLAGIGIAITAVSIILFVIMRKRAEAF